MSTTLPADFLVPEEPAGTVLGIVLANSTPIGILEGLGKIEMVAREFVEIDNKIVNYFLILTITSSGDFPSISSVTVERDEITKITLAIDKLRQSNPKITKFQNFEAKFTSKNQAVITVFTNQSRLAASISHGGATAFFRSDLELNTLKSHLLAAAAYFEENKFHFPE